jgi:hypothetical protein
VSRQHSIEDVEEQKGSNNRNKGTKRGNQISRGIRIGIIGDTPGHSRKAQKMHGKKSDIYSDEESSKVDSTEKFIEF